MNQNASRTVRGLTVAVLTTQVLGSPIFVKPGASGTGDGTSWANAYTHLQTALENAKEGDEIWVASTGIHYPDEGAGQTNNDRASTFQLVDGVAIYGGFVGNETLRSQRKPTNFITILSGDLLKNGSTPATFGDNAHHVVTGSGVGPTTILDGFVITGGNANDPSSPNGGGLVCEANATPTISNNFFIGNSAGSGGGAMHLGKSADASVINCTFQGNFAGKGGAIRSESASPLIVNCSFQGNSADSGGAIFNSEGITTLVNSVIWNNLSSGSSTSPDASIVSDAATTHFSHCIVANVEKSELDGNTASSGGNLEPNDPGFVFELDPSEAPVPVTAENRSLLVRSLGLLAGSPAAEAGDHSQNPSAFDIANRPRIIDADFDTESVIDLGAHERPAPLLVKKSATGANDGSSWTDAFVSLQDAISVATEGTDIWIAAGTYFPDEGSSQTPDDRASTFNLHRGIAIYGGFDGISGVFSHREPSSHPTILSGDLLQNDDSTTATIGDNAERVVTAVFSTDPTSLLDGVTITRGNATGDGEFSLGGGMRIAVEASPRIIRCVFDRNISAGVGGGLAIFDRASPIVSDCSFTGNQALRGAGMTTFPDSTPTILRCVFRGNSASTIGGGMENFASKPEVFDSVFQGNLAGDLGGGVFNGSNSESAFTNCTLQGNRAGISGGGMHSQSHTSLALTNCILWNNMAASSTTIASASIAGLPFSANHCLIANFTAAALGGANNLDSADPKFVSESDPASAPSLDGNLRIIGGSPAADAGDNSANDNSVDLSGYPRIVDGDGDSTATIDLGAYEGRSEPEIEITFGEGSPLSNNAPLDLGILRLEDISTELAFSIRNLGFSPLTGIALTVSGPDAADMTIGTPLPVTLAPGASAPLTSTLSHSGEGDRQIDFSIASNDVSDNPFFIATEAVIAADGLDRDTDGLSNYQELSTHGTDPRNPDSDSDGAKDGAEVALAGLGFRNDKDDSDKLALIQSNALGLDLFTAENLQALSLDAPVISRNPGTGKFSITTGLRQSPDLATPFEPFNDFTPSFDPETGELILEFDPPSPDAHFFQLFLGPPPTPAD